MKKLLLSLFAGFVGIISFCSSIDVGYGNNYTAVGINPGENSFTYTIPGNSIFTIIQTSALDISLVYSGITYGPAGNGYFIISFLNRSSNSETVSFTILNGNTTKKWINTYIDILFSNSLSCPECPTCDDPYTSLECQTEYNLIPVEDVDINYCVGNGLCPNECGSGTDLSGDLQYSNIYINSILHPGEENIFIDIPDYIQWDYSVDTGNFNIYVGSGYDMDYMNSIIKINSYRPTSSDFTNIFVSGLTLIFPYIFVLLLIVFIWKLIKRVFK